MTTIETPSVKEISDNIIAQLEAILNQTIPILPKGFNRTIAKAIAGVFILLYKYGGWIFLQLFVRTASFQETEILGKKVIPLIEWGRLIGIGDPVRATQAELLVDITVENQTGSILAGTLLTSNKNGINYLLTASVVLDAAIKQGNIKATSDTQGGSGAGAIGNLDPGDVVSFVNPIPNVARDTTVDSQVVTAADGETEAQYRQRVIDRFQKQPQGGAGVDYEIWGEEVAGIINIFPYTGAIAGFVDVYSEATPASSGSPDGIPTQAQLNAVETAITFDSESKQTRKPVNARLNSFAIDRIGFDVSVLGLTVDDPATVQSSIESAVETYFLDREPFIEGVTPLPRTDRITLQNIEGIIDDIVTAANGSFLGATLTKTGDLFTIDFYPLGIGEKSKLTIITF